MLYPRDPSIQIIPTLGPKVCKYCLHWAIWIPRDRESAEYNINVKTMETKVETTNSCSLELR